jgi:hypothetical protein
MIDLFRTWLPQIIGAAEDLQSGRLERAWTLGERGISAYYSGELHEQVFGDLDADAMLEKARLALAPHPELVEALASFLGSLKRLDQWIETHMDTESWGKGQSIPAEVAGIFQTDEWRTAWACAASFVAVAGGVGFSSRDLELGQGKVDQDPACH